ncbi:phage tail tape measure protein [Chryseobacterium arthrosphaerae]|uniref:phage tail tape measure protein n=1 Tax=Chryseobacterium arthrosphaerae TaxID=651561 RepID=UPI000F4EC7E4|nr:phage tail tape measure protein [Chryseobacterium arthrosphaerae]AYZ12898.1 phage tail tape measure protein [Chryseobacterium arthrosphaerae]
MATTKLMMLVDLSAKLFNNGLQRLQNRWNQGVDNMKRKYQSLIDMVPGLDGALDKLKNPSVVFGAAFMAAFGFLSQATKMANDWEVKMAEINVTAGLSKKELRGLSDQLLDVGARNSSNLDEVPKAFTRIISAGLDVDQSLKALEPTMRAAKAGFTDVETVAGAGIATMMSSGKEINKVYDVLFETVKEGNAEFKDIARYLPKVIPLARSIGYELESTAGAYASLTTKLSAEQSSTALEGIMRTLSNADVAMGKTDSKTGKYISGFRSLGINVFDATGKIRPLIDIVAEINKQMDGLTDEQKVKKLSKLGFDQATALGFGTLAQDIEGLKKATIATSTAQGSLDQAYIDSLTPMEQYDVIQNNIKASMIKLGQAALPYLTAGLEKVAPLFQWMYQNVDSLIPVFLAFTATLGILTVATWAWNSALFANPVTWIILGISALVAVIALAIAKYDEWGATLLLFMGPIGRVISALKGIYDHWDSIKKAFNDGGIIAGLERIGIVLLDVIIQPIEQLLKLMSHLPGSLGRAAKDMQGTVRKFREDLDLVDTSKEVLDKKRPEYLDAMKAHTEKVFNPKKPIDPTSLYGTEGGAFKDPGVPDKDKKKKLKDGVNKVTGEAKQVRNITITIGSLNSGGINVKNDEFRGMTKQDVEDWFNNGMMRILRNVETS